MYNIICHAPPLPRGGPDPRSTPRTHEASGAEQAVRNKFATELSSQLLSSYLSGGTDRVELIYTKFISLISSTPAVRTLLPLSATGIETEGDEIFTLTTKDGDFEVEKTEFGATPAKE